MKKIACYLAILLIVIALVVAVGLLNFSNWNDEICYHCEKGHWVFSYAVGRQNSTNYLYQCDHCGMTHEFYYRYELMDVNP